MKLKNIAKNTLIFAMVLIVTLLSVICVHGIPDETAVATENPGVIETTSPIVETEPESTQPTTVATEQATVPSETQPETEPLTEPEQESAETEEPTEESTRTTYAETQAVTHSLPSAPMDTIPTAVVVAPEREGGDLTYGIVIWVCVIVGIFVVVVVLLSNKTRSHGSSGKQRYDEGNRITGQKRLLKDDYYDQRNNQSYFNKDTRR